MADLMSFKRPVVNDPHGARVALSVLEHRVADLEHLVRDWPALTASWRADLDAQRAAMQEKGWL